MRCRLLYLSCCFVLFLPRASFGQGEYYNANDLSYFFEDGGVATSKSILKTDLFSATIGNPSVNFEYNLGNRWSSEVSVGITGLFYLQPFNSFVGYTNLGLLNPQSPSFSFSVQPRLYFRGNEGFYNAVKYRFRSHMASNTDEQIERHEILFYSGFTERYNNRFVNDMSLGFGVLIEKSQFTTGSNNRLGFVLSLGFKPGLWL